MLTVRPHSVRYMQQCWIESLWRWICQCRNRCDGGTAANTNRQPYNPRSERDRESIWNSRLLWLLHLHAFDPLARDSLQLPSSLFSAHFTLHAAVLQVIGSSTHCCSCRATRDDRSREAEKITTAVRQAGRAGHLSISAGVKGWHGFSMVCKGGCFTYRQSTPYIRRGWGRARCFSGKKGGRGRSMHACASTCGLQPCCAATRFNSHSVSLGGLLLKRFNSSRKRKGWFGR